MSNTMFPGAELIEQGLLDLAGGVESVASLLVSIGAPRLRTLGHDVRAPIEDADLRLYAVLSRTHGDAAHGQYNALVRQLVSYERARCVI